MAILVAAGGALLGSGGLLGGLTGSQGWLVGSIIGNLLFPNLGPSTTVEGPRLGDLTVTASTYGASIPVPFGTVRLAGNMIWSTGIEEVKNVDKQRVGKGGGGATNTTITYEYFGTFAIAFCKGQASDVLRIWADGKLLYDKTGSGDDIQKVDLRYRFYPGSETQEPDSLMVDDLGEDSAPAHRDLCYIVFERLPLKDFGNRIPNITAEITMAARSTRPEETMDFFTEAEGGEVGTWQNSHILPDFKRGVMYSTNPSGTPANNYLRRFKIRSMEEDRQSQIIVDTLGNPVTFLTLIAVLPNGYVVCTSGSSNRAPIILIDPNTMEPVSTFGEPTSDLNNSPEGFEDSTSSTSYIQTGSGKVFLFTASIFNSIGILNASNGSLEYVWDSDSFDSITEARILNTCPGARGRGFGEGYYMAGPLYNTPNSGDVRIAKVTVSDAAMYDTDSATQIGVEVEDIVTLGPNDIIPGESSLANCVGPIYDETDDTIMIQAINAAETASYMLKIDPVDGTILWRTALPDGSSAFNGVSIEARNSLGGWNYGRNLNGTYGQMNGVDSFALRTSDGELIFYEDDWSSGYNTSGSGWWDGKTATFIGLSGTNSIVKWLFFRGDGEGQSLDEVVEDLCARVGLEASDVDVTDLSTETVRGYILSRQTSARSAIEQLAGVYFFDGVESDFILKFTLRDGKSSVASVTQDELVTMNDSGEFFQESIAQEVELPMRFSLSYMDYEKDYQQGTQSSKRVQAPQATMQSKNELSLGAPIVLDVTTAKQMTEKALFSSWLERHSYSAQLSWKYLALDPSDVFTITLDNGAVFRTRLIGADVGADLVIAVNGISEDAAQYTSTTAADNGVGTPDVGFLSETLTKAIVLCSPLLRDSDDVGRTVSQVYYFMGGYGQPGWQSATLFKSSDTTQWDEAGASAREMTWGTCATVLGDTDTPFATDQVNDVRVFLNTNNDIGLSSCTQLEMLNGANAAAIIHRNGVDVEIIQFRTATLNNDGSYTLSNLLRGRRGSDPFTSGHRVGDTFVLLESLAGDSLSLALGEVDQDRYYRAVTTGAFFEDADTITKASPGNDLKPYAPVHISVASGSWGSDLGIEWERRTRIGGQLQDGHGTVPLAEDAEEYELDILTGSGRVLRTIDSLNSASATYTMAQQSSDFPGGYIDETATLMTNPSFEASTTDNGDQVPGWTQGSNPLTLRVRTGTDGNISGAQSGNNWLSMEESAFSSSSISQTMDLSGYAEVIDAGLLSVRLSGYVAASTADTDTGRIDTVWLDVDGNEISTDTGTETDPADDGSWTQIQEANTAPNSARYVRMELHGTLNSGSFIRVSWDNTSIEINEGTKAYLSVRAYQVSAQVGRGFPSRITVLEV